MSYPGPWFQPGDYEKFGTWRLYDYWEDSQGGLHPNNQMASPYIEKLDPWGAGADETAAMNAALGIQSGTYRGDNVTAEIQIGLGGKLHAVVVDSSTAYNQGTKSLGAMRVGPQDGLGPPAPPPYPPGVVGYEWQSATGAVQRVNLVAENLQPTIDESGTIQSGVLALELGVDGDSEVMPLDYTGATLIRWDYSSDSPTDLAVTGTFDITGYVSPNGQFQLMGNAQASVGHVQSELNWAASWGIGLTVYPFPFAIRYTIRPPLLRWLYATPQTPPGLPPLRQHPRRDGLGASTARRHYPPDRSVQASNRRRGGFY